MGPGWRLLHIQMGNTKKVSNFFLHLISFFTKLLTPDKKYIVREYSNLYYFHAIVNFIVDIQWNTEEQNDGAAHNGTSIAQL